MTKGLETTDTVGHQRNTPAFNSRKENFHIGFRVQYFERVAKLRVNHFETVGGRGGGDIDFHSREMVF